MTARITAAEAEEILRDLARGREDGSGADVWPLYERAEDAMAEVIALAEALRATDDRVAAAVAAERTRLVAMLPWCDGAGHPNATHGHACAARAEVRATWGRLDWQRRLCRDCAEAFRAETGASVELLPWEPIVREYRVALSTKGAPDV